MEYRWTEMGSKPLKFDVKCNSKVVIPAGTVGVKIAFQQSHMTYVDSFGRKTRMNVYMAPDGKMYHA